MKNQILKFFTVFFVLNFWHFSSLCQNTEKQYVVVLSMDGFRWDYSQKTSTPNLDAFGKQGVKAKSLKPCYPSKTFPNHFSIATGLYPDHHGLVQNEFYDKYMDLYYSLRNRKAVENPLFYEGEPIWVTAEKQDIITAAYFWVGSETPIKGIQPRYWKKYDVNVPFENRIDSVINWLSLPEAVRPQLIMWYMSEPDAIGHEFGPNDKRTLLKVQYLDSLIGVYLSKIDKLANRKNINLIITSDHGMGELSKDRRVNLNDYVKKNWCIDVRGDNPVTMIQPKKEYEDTIYNTLKKVPHIKIWKKSELPERLHYGTHPRIYKFVVEADSSWSITWKSTREYADGGAHGYDNDNTDMHGIFYAKGSAFKQNYIHKTFPNINIYPLIAKILHIKPAPIDGKLEEVIDMLN